MLCSVTMTSLDERKLNQAKKVKIRLDTERVKSRDTPDGRSRRFQARSVLMMSAREST